MLKVVVVHFHLRHSLRYQQWKRIRENFQGPTVLLLVDHNSFIVKAKDAYRPPEFKQPAAL